MVTFNENTNTENILYHEKSDWCLKESRLWLLMTVLATVVHSVCENSTVSTVTMCVCVSFPVYAVYVNKGSDQNAVSLL